MPQNRTDRLRVLYVDNSIGFGGAIKSLALTLRKLADVDALIVTAQDRKLVETWLPGHRVRLFRQIVNYRSMERVRGWAGSTLLRGPLAKAVALADVAVTAKNAVWLVWLLRRERIQVMHLNNGFHPPEALWAARVTGTPWIVHLRGFHVDTAAPTLRAMRRVTHVVTCSQAVADDLRGTPVPQDRITAIHDPVDLEKVERAAGAREPVRRRYGLEPRHVVMGIFGRVVEWKGQMVFVKAAIRAMRHNPDIRAVIVGDESDGGRGYFEEIRAVIRESGMAERFVLPGYTDDVESFYAAMDVVVHASIEPEPFGMVVPEGMAARCAVIAADEGGPREVVRHGYDGLLVPPGDDEALSGAMLRLASDPVERERMAENAFLAARHRFGLDANARAVRAIYDLLLCGPAHGREPGPAAEALAEAS